MYLCSIANINKKMEIYSKIFDIRMNRISNIESWNIECSNIFDWMEYLDSTYSMGSNIESDRISNSIESLKIFDGSNIFC